jgi:hypothetical protein
MIIGFALFALGYAVFYWGLHHFITPRYSLYCLLGLGSLFANVQIPAGQKVTIESVLP